MTTFHFPKLSPFCCFSCKRCAWILFLSTRNFPFSCKIHIVSNFVFKVKNDFFCNYFKIETALKLYNFLYTNLGFLLGYGPLHHCV